MSYKIKRFSFLDKLKKTFNPRYKTKEELEEEEKRLKIKLSLQKNLEGKIDKLLDYFELSSEENRPHFKGYLPNSYKISPEKYFIVGWITVDYKNRVSYVLDIYDRSTPPPRYDWYDRCGDYSMPENEVKEIWLPRFWMIGTKKEFDNIQKGVKTIFPGIKKY